MDGILIIQDEKFVKANDVVLKMLKYESRDEFLNLYPADLSPEFQPDGQSSKTKSEKMNEICLREGSNHFEWVHTKGDGEEFWCDVSLSKVNV